MSAIAAADLATAREAVVRGEQDLCWSSEGDTIGTDAHDALDALAARIALLEAALAEAINHVVHMEMPDTGVIGPGGEREKDHHEALLYADVQRWEALAGGR